VRGAPLRCSHLRQQRKGRRNPISVPNPELVPVYRPGRSWRWTLNGTQLADAGYPQLRMDRLSLSRRKGTMFGTYGLRSAVTGPRILHGGCMRIGSPHSRAILAVCAATLPITLATSCNSESQDHPRTLPPATSTPTSTQGSTAKPLEGELARVYQRHLESIPAAENTSGRQRRQILQEWLTEPLLTRVLDNMAAAQAAGRRAYGRTPFQVLDGTSNGDKATLKICQDESEAGVQDVETGRKINKGLPNTPYVLHYTRTNERWLLADIEAPQGDC